MTEPKAPVIPLATQAPAPKTLSLAARTRLWCLLIGGISGALLALGLWLRPDPHGSGTHEQLGFPPCGMLTFTGIPCPTCGCTTAVTYFSHGNLIKSFITQPFGFAVGLLAAAALILAVISFIRGKWLGPSPFFFQWHYKKLLILGGVVMAAGWAYKILAVRWGF